MQEATAAAEYLPFAQSMQAPLVSAPELEYLPAPQSMQSASAIAGAAEYLP
jgi:hypothetical protein